MGKRPFEYRVVEALPDPAVALGGMTPAFRALLDA
jgi:hypothetical protein